jgi:dihydrodipicolinate synthase/N-acetylneuraminate lyase
MVKKPIFPGIIAPLITPFTKEEILDEKTFRSEVKYLLNTGIHGISPGGSTGEGELIRDEELVRMVEIIQEENFKKIPVVAGVIRTSTRDAIRIAIAVKKAGATALMITPIQYLGGADSNGNYEYYDRISDAVGLPIIIYNVVSQNEIKPDLFYKMLDIENVIGIKQTNGGVSAFLEMMMTCGKKGSIYSASNEMLYTTFDLGATGAIATVLTLFPKIAVEIWDAVKAGDSARAKALQAKIYPVWNKIKGPQFPRRIKEALSQMGRSVGNAASPRSAASSTEKECIRRALQQLNSYKYFK